MCCLCAVLVLLGPMRPQAVFDLPSRMQAALDEDALDSAVSFYAEALPVLRKYGHKGAFRGVAMQADAAAKQVSTALKRRLAERKDETEHVVLLLRQLGEGDDTLQVGGSTHGTPINPLIFTCCCQVLLGSG